MRIETVYTFKKFRGNNFAFITYQFVHGMKKTTWP